jgi:hypothetical protein
MFAPVRHQEALCKPQLKPGAFSKVDLPKKSVQNSAAKAELKNSPIKIVEENKENDKNRANRLLASPGFGYKYSMKATPLKERHSNQKTPEKNHSKQAEARNSVENSHPHLQDLLLQLENEKKLNAEYRKRLHQEKTVTTTLKNKVKQLEDEKSKQEETHKKSLLNIEQKVATLKNTNVQLLNKANRFDSFSQELADLKEYRENVSKDLR